MCSRVPYHSAMVVDGNLRTTNATCTHKTNRDNAKTRPYVHVPRQTKHQLHCVSHFRVCADASVIHVAYSRLRGVRTLYDMHKTNLCENQLYDLPSAFSCMHECNLMTSGEHVIQLYDLLFALSPKCGYQNVQKRIIYLAIKRLRIMAGKQITQRSQRYGVVLLAIPGSVKWRNTNRN